MKFEKDEKVWVELYKNLSFEYIPCTILGYGERVDESCPDGTWEYLEVRAENKVTLNRQGKEIPVDYKLGLGINVFRRTSDKYLDDIYKNYNIKDFRYE